MNLCVLCVFALLLILKLFIIIITTIIIIIIITYYLLLHCNLVTTLMKGVKRKEHYNDRSIIMKYAFH